jgi:hypothetical protein
MRVSFGKLLIALLSDQMHIHYGLKDKNPVAHLRFFPKQHHDLFLPATPTSTPAPLFSTSTGVQQDSSNISTTSNPGSKGLSAAMMTIGREMDEKVYAAGLPRVFEDKKVRVFCRVLSKAALAREAFAVWSREANTHSPFPSRSSQQLLPQCSQFEAEEQEEEEEEEV